MATFESPTGFSENGCGNGTNDVKRYLKNLGEVHDAKSRLVERRGIV